MELISKPERIFVKLGKHLGKLFKNLINESSPVVQLSPNRGLRVRFPGTQYRFLRIFCASLLNLYA